MKLFVMIGYDGPNGLALRQEIRPAHLANLEPLDQARRIRHGGPLLKESGEPVGSAIVFEAESLGAAREIAAQDPYVTGGVFERYEVYETKGVFPQAQD